MITNTTNVVGGGIVYVASRIGREEDEPPCQILLRWCELTYMISSEGGSHV